MRSACSLSAGAWLEMIGLMLVGLIPFAVLGILLGHLLTLDSLGPAPWAARHAVRAPRRRVGSGREVGPVFDVIKALPSYWLVQAGKTAVGGGAWPAEAWIVIGVWTAVLVPLAGSGYRRDTSRV